MPESVPCYVVRRLVPEHMFDPREQLSGPVAVARFATYEDAEADRQRRERVVRAETNPFHLRLFDVVELPSQPRRVYLVQEVGWHRDEDGVPLLAGSEARRAVEVFTNRGSAEVRREELERENRAVYRASGWFQWFDIEEFPHDDSRHARLYEVVVIDLEDA